MNQDNKHYLSPWAPPAEEGKSAMMDHMKWGQVCELLTGNKKHRVSQVNKLKKIKSIMVRLVFSEVKVYHLWVLLYKESICIWI